MDKKSIRSNFGGWIGHTIKDPEKMLYAIWERARTRDCGFMPSSPERGYLDFEGIRIEIDNEVTRSIDEFMGNAIYHKIRLLFISKNGRLHPGFFDLWFELVADGVVRDGPTQEDKQLFANRIDRKPIDKTILPDVSQVTSEWDVKLEKLAFLWMNRGYTRKWGYNVEDWLDEHNASDISGKQLQRKARQIKSRENKS